MVTSDDPVLSDATGTTDAFAVPTRYKGDSLVTLAARRSCAPPRAPPPSAPAVSGRGVRCRSPSPSATPAGRGRRTATRGSRRPSPPR
ncbi:hypothetical protein ACFZC6_17285 [Streptomyces ossamyceticus]|uniref:Endoglucanase B carbohydrate binding domain-containing protein n=1 Tax=Streptomyces ossamyceticus TaxID=249581 RepID=A0ABV2UNV5_9ACTN